MFRRHCPAVVLARLARAQFCAATVTNMRILDGISLVILTGLVAHFHIEAAPSISLLARKGQSWPPHAEEFQKHWIDSSNTKPDRPRIHPSTDLFGLALQQSTVARPSAYTDSRTKDSVSPRQRGHRVNQDKLNEGAAQRRGAAEPESKERQNHERSNIFPDNGPQHGMLQQAPEYDYDFWPSQSSVNGVDNNVGSSSMPCQKGNPHVDSQNCTDPSSSANYQFPSGVMMIEAHYNQTVRDFLRICGEVELVEVDGTDDIQTLINSIHRHVSKYDQGPANSAVFLFNLENFSKWTKERIIDVIRTSVDTMRANFDDLMIYSKFHRDGTESTETVLLQLRYDVKFWLADLCSKGLARCADLSSIALGSVIQLSSDIEDQLGPSFSLSMDASTALTQKYCRRLGLGPGTRIIDVKPVPGDGTPQTHHLVESSLMLSDLLPKDQMTYDKNRPPKYHGRPTVVYYHVTVLSIDTINEESMTYVADIFLGQSWRDHRLRLPENMTTDYRILDVSWLQNIWRPDCFFKNAKRVTFHEMSVPNHYLWLYHDKTLLYMAKLTLVLSCAMKFETYPHDTQICSLMIESLSHTTHDLVFKWNITDPLVVNPDIELPQLDIAKNMTEDCTLEYSTGNFTCLAVVFNLQRRLGYHLFHTYIPSALIVVMSWISFWIKPEAIPARVTLGVTSLLTLATQSTQSQRSLPPVSYVKGIDIWMASCTVFVFMSLMEFAVVNHFMGPVATKLMKGYSDENIVSTKGGFSTNGRGGSLRTRGRSPDRAAIPITPQYVTFCHGREVALFIDKWSRLFFPFSFIILNIVYWFTFLPPQETYA